MPDLKFETEIGGIVAGLDEVGRGPLAGPVLAAACIIDPARLPARLLDQLDDSKKLSAKKRQSLVSDILEFTTIGFGIASVEEIDRINILKATFLAMKRAIADLGVTPSHVLVDGNQVPPLDLPCTPLVGGDGISLSIAAASIAAKVRRDAIMAELALEYPGYGWEKNAGYGTKAHMEGLKNLGPTPHHRKSFAPIAQLSLL